MAGKNRYHEKNARIAIYAVIALLAIVMTLSLLAQVPEPGWPIRLMQLLFRE